MSYTRPITELIQLAKYNPDNCHLTIKFAQTAIRLCFTDDDIDKHFLLGNNFPEYFQKSFKVESN
jgi:hypothetical protein